MSQPEKLSSAQLNSYLTRINTGGVPEVIKIYQELQDKGYGYAGWAKGVATAETVTGLAAVDYLTGTALIGLGGEEYRNLGDAQVDAIAQRDGLLQDVFYRRTGMQDHDPTRRNSKRSEQIFEPEFLRTNVMWEPAE